MISPVDLMKRLGVGGRLVPFFKCVCVYLVAVCGEERAPSPGAAAAKCAPVLCLLLLVLLHRAALTTHKGEYAARVAGGLALSALGDALLVWPHMFVWGMAAFGGAHVCYAAAFGARPLAPGAGAVLLAAAGAYLCRVAPGPAAGALRCLVPAYALLLSGMAWRGAARGGWAAAGALLFLASDALLGYSMFAARLPYDRVLVMATYYLGQLGIALSALAPPERTEHDASAPIPSESAS